MVAEELPAVGEGCSYHFAFVAEFCVGICEVVYKEMLVRDGILADGEVLSSLEGVVSIVRSYGASHNSNRIDETSEPADVLTQETWQQQADIM